jgi:hypothetical protein
MKPLYKILIFEALIGGYVLLFFRYLIADPITYGQPFVMFVASAFVAFFVQGPPLGVMPPTSNRGLMIALGVLVMVTSVVWTLAIRGHV